MKTRGELSRIYDILWGEADALLKQHNPCEVCKTSRGLECNRTKQYSGNDLASAQRTAEGVPQSQVTRLGVLCCGGCKHHDPEIGCTVKSLMCKTWLCNAADAVAPRELIAGLNIIKRKANEAGIHMGGRATKDEDISYSLRLQLEWKRRGHGDSIFT